MSAALKYLDVLRLALIAYAVALVVGNDALRTDVYVIVFTEVFGLLVGVLWAELFRRSVFIFFLLLGGHVLLRVEVVQDREVLNQLLDVRREIVAACWASQDVGSAQIHQTVLAEGMAACQNSRNLLLVVVMVKADWAGDFHLSLIRF